MKRIGIITGARSDYGIYQPILKELAKSRGLSFGLYVTGMHLSNRYGKTISEIEKDGHPIWRKIPFPMSKDSPVGLAEGLGVAVQGFARAFKQTKPDLLLVLGDRLEMLAGAAAALPFAIPVAHIHGGELTQGQIDESIRHALTKMSHLHFVSTTIYKRRLIQMGEESWRITVSGAPSLDHLKTLPLLSTEALEKTLGIPLDPAPLLVTYHPVTLDYNDTSKHIIHLLSALKQSRLPIIFTYPNSDTHNRLIISAIQHFVRNNRLARVLVNAGTQTYFSLMKHALAMVGNSSSGIIEAASFHLPVVDVGDRQKGRFHSSNVIHVGYDPKDILQGIERARSSAFRSNLKALINPYGKGHASKVIVQELKTIPLNRRLLHKQFVDSQL